MVHALALSMYLIFSQVAGASCWTENYGIPLREMDEAELQAETEYTWLYEILFPEKIRIEAPEESFKSFRVHLRDTLKVFPNPEEISRDNLNDLQRIEGRITYSGFFKKKYRYDVGRDPTGALILEVRIYFENATETDWADFTWKIRQAQDLWNSQRIATDFGYLFRFEAVQDASAAHFSVEILDNTRGPYDQFWSRRWTPRTVAHEIGHMLGLGDEYDTLSGKTDCLTNSLMCQSSAGGLMRHHYYFVLRRLLKAAEPQEMDPP